MSNKKVLFIISTLRCGGAEHALVSLLKVMNYNLYDVDLLVLCRNGMFYHKEIPEEVTMLKPDFSVTAILEPTLLNLSRCLFLGKWNIIYLHIKRLFKNYVKKEKYIGNFWSYYWRDYGKYIKSLEKSYDIAVGYLEGISNYYCVDKVTARKKIGWVHTNYSDSGQNIEMDRKYFGKFNYLVTMSEPASTTLSSVFPEYKDKINTIHNILDEKEVVNLSEEKIKDIENDFDGTTIVSVGNILPVKGYDMAVEVCKKLLDSGYKIRWIVIGRKDQTQNIESLIEKYNLLGSFILLGMKKNPYKYMKMADIFVQCSRYEGYSTTIKEAKILCKPIVATDCQGINDQITNGINGTLTDIDSQSIYEGIVDLIRNSNKRANYQNELRKEKEEKNDIELELNKLYKIWEESVN